VVADICRRLDGLPLAIELAAARCGLLSPREIAERLDASLAGLAVGPRDAPARQQTLRATIDWSHELLSDVEQECFAALSVFAAGATVAAAETITSAELDTLDHLVAKSLLVRHQHARAPTRLAMLGTVRTYAGERLAASADSDAVYARHHRYYATLAERHGTEQALCSRNRERHLAQLDADIDNLHASLHWSVRNGNAEHALAMVAALAWYWLVRDRYADALHWIEQALSVPGAERDPALRARALLAKVMVLWPSGRRDEQANAMAELETIVPELADPVIASRMLQERAYMAQDDAQREVADALAEDALLRAQTSGDRWEIAKASSKTVSYAPTLSELHTRVDRAASLLDAVGNIFELAAMRAGTPYGALYLGNHREALEFAERAIPIVREHGTPLQWTRLCGNVGLAALITGDTDRATDAFREELQLSHELVIRPLASEALHGLAVVAAAHRDDDRAARLIGAAVAHGGVPHDAVETRLDTTFLQPARTRIGPDAWDTAAREGAHLSLQQAIAWALDQPSR
jgi:predicted ATPase